MDRADLESDDRMHVLRRPPSVYFVNSMSDLFHKDVADSFLDRVFEVIRATPQHTYQIRTKRARRLPRYFALRECPDNAWLGVSVENKRSGTPRIAADRPTDSGGANDGSTGSDRASRPRRHRVVKSSLALAEC